MKFPSPSSSGEYPKYIIGYWLVLWFISFGLLTVFALDDITPDGKYLRRVPCEVEVSAGRYDEGTECLEYGEPTYSPLGSELKDYFKRSGILWSVICILLGGLAMRMKRKEERLMRGELENSSNIVH